ncbi:MAG TPA: S8 family serine peptidase [Anaerolineaceae bacterium]
MQKAMRFLIIAVLLVGFVAMPAAAAPGGPNSDQPTTTVGVDNTRAIVQLQGDPLSTYVKTKPPQGKKIDFNQSTVKSYRAQLSALRNDFKDWLRANAPKAKVTSEYDVSLNAVAVSLNGETLEKIASAPLVVQAQYEGLYVPTFDTSTDVDLEIIKATEAWAQAGGDANAGAGVKVAILDTGIDITHPCFSDGGYVAQKQLGDTTFTNNKVIVAKVFNMKTPSAHYTPEALQEHGTHVAGTVACNFGTTATVDGVTIPHTMSGVAPKALLGNYNIFPGEVTNAHSEDILNALEAAYADGFDVANMSLGGNSSGIQDLVSMAVDDLDQANMVIAIAAGNSGPGHYTVESPGRAARALTAGASTVPHFIATPVTVNGKTFAAGAGDFALVKSDLTAPLGVVLNGANLGTACAALPAGSLTGKIALISRGACSFSTKIRFAQGAGAVAVIMVNNVGGDPIAMGQDGTPNQPTIPAYMVSVDDKAALMADAGLPATISVTMAYFVSSYADIMASFSSQGPTDVDFRVKPDVVAPGVNVLSSIPHQFCGAPPCFAFFQGTSMATPHLAGSAAVVIGQHPDWTAEEVRSAIVNTADQGVLKNYQLTGIQRDVNVIGAGRENLLSAVNATVALSPVSISFGAIPSGSGQTQTFTVTLTNLSGAGHTFNLAISNTTNTGVVFSASPASLTLGAGESATFTLTMSAEKGAGPGDHQAKLAVMVGDTEVAHAAVYTLIK